MSYMKHKDDMDKWILCRICLDQPSTGLESIFHQNDEKDLTLLIQECGGVPIKQFDHYPDKICAKCLQCLKEAYIFRRTCQHSHKRLSELIAPMDVDIGEQQGLGFVEEYTIEELELKFDPTNAKTKIKTETALDMYNVFDDATEEFVPKTDREIAKFATIKASKSTDTTVVGSTNQQIISHVEEDNDKYLELGVKTKVEIVENEMISEVFDAFEEGAEEFIKGEANAFEDEDEELIKKDKTEKADCLGELENELFSKTSDDEYAPHPKKSLSHKVKVKGKNKKQKSVSGSRIKMSANTKDEEFLPSTEKSFDCETCERTFISKSHLSRHIRTHTAEHPHKCKICERAFIRKTQLTDHMRTHTGERPYKCSVCPKAFPTLDSRRKHHRTHTNERPYTCDICSKSFKANQELKTHKIEMHQIIDIDRNLTIHQCEFCERTFIRKAHLTYHMRAHTGERPYKCSDCPKTFKNPGALNWHYRTHTNERPYTCNICGKCFNDERASKIHQVEVHNIIDTDRNYTIYQCKLCERAYIAKCRFMSHMNNKHPGEYPKIHTIARPYTCDICSKSFNRKQILERHKVEVHNMIETCNNREIYKCEVCERTYIVKSQYTRHMTTHTGERPYKCSDCPKAFRDRATLKKHSRTHENERSMTDGISHISKKTNIKNESIS